MASSERRSLAFACALAFASWTAPADDSASPGHFSVTGSVGAKTGFDSNVRLQSYSDAVEQSSAVTVFQPSVRAEWRDSQTVASLAYGAEAAVFSSAHEEDHVVHRLASLAQATAGRVTCVFSNTLVVIDGSDVGPTWSGPGGSPATGGPAVRDRRDALAYRSSLRGTVEIQGWLARPVVTGYVQDFQTRHSVSPGYQNYVDRNEWTVGLDLGRPLKPGFNAFADYRYGAQDQSRLLQFSEEYDNSFHRVLFALEGRPWHSVQVNISAGPEFREFGAGVPKEFGDRDRENLFADISLVWTLPTSDAVSLCFKRLEQPGFAGRSTYHDFTAELGWKRELRKGVSVGASGRAYNTDFSAPVLKEDWVLSAGGFINWALPSRWNFELSYLYENGQSELPNMEGREYARHAAFAGVKYKFPAL